MICHQGSEYRGFALVLVYYILLAILFLFCLFSVLFFCVCTIVVFYMSLCAGLIIGTCAVKPAR
jgi:hypothetical protein